MSAIDLTRLLALAEAAIASGTTQAFPTEAGFNFIAAADPTAIAALIRRLIAAEAVVEAAKAHEAAIFGSSDAYRGTLNALRAALVTHAAALAEIAKEGGA